MNKETTFNKMASRKLWYAIGLSTASVGLLATKRLNPEHFVNINKYVFSAYVLGNVGQKTFKADIGKKATIQIDE